MHRDIKPENLLVDNSELEKDRFNIKVIDFGISDYFKPNEIKKLSIGSPYYVAPEVINE